MIPPAPPAENRRVAARPAIVIWYDSCQRSRTCLPDHALEQGDVGGEHQEDEGERDRDPDRVAVVELLRAGVVADTDDLREEQVDGDEGKQRDDDRLHDPLRALEELGLGVVVEPLGGRYGGG